MHTDATWHASGGGFSQACTEQAKSSALEFRQVAWLVASISYAGHNETKFAATSRKAIRRLFVVVVLR